MTSKKLITKAQDMHGRMILKLHRIENEEQTSMMTRCERSLMAMDKVIRELKNLVAEHIFDSSAEEITFFKNIKPQFVSEFIFYSEILRIEASKPELAGKDILKYYRNAVKEQKNHYLQDTEFFAYYRRQATYLDHKYFLRNAWDLKMKIPGGLYDRDEKFTTSHDYLISGFMAVQKMTDYIKSREVQTEQQKDNLTVKKTALHWSASKASLIELLYALHQMRCLNGGNISMTEIVLNAEVIFGMQIDNHKKIIHEIRNRKMMRTKFLSGLTENLEKHFLDGDI